MKHCNNNVFGTSSRSNSKQVKDKNTAQQPLDSCHETTTNSDIKQATITATKDTNVYSSSSDKQGMRSRTDTASDCNSTAQQQQRQQQQDMTMTARNTSEIQKNRLVFGLNSRTNKTKHDQYAEKRSGNESIVSTQSSFASSQQQSQPERNLVEPKATGESLVSPAKTSACSVPSKTESTSQISPTTTSTTASGTVSRPLKYGSSHTKPQVEISTSKDDTAKSREPRSSSHDRKKVLTKKSPVSSSDDTVANPDGSETKSKTSTRDPSPNSSTATKTRRVVRRKVLTKSSAADDSGDVSGSEDKEDRTGQKKKVSATTDTPSSIPSSINGSTNKISSNSSSKISVPKVTKERSQEDTATNSGNQKTTISQQESPKSNKGLIKSSSFDDATTIATNKRDDSTSSSSASTASITINPAPSPRLQFNIPPPPRQTTSSIKSSVVTNAKSRIYDSPKHPNNINKQSLNSLPSIVSSFKPPKQVNVSKAREKWEEGEPFISANNRRQRSLGKKTLLSSWSVSSVDSQWLGGNSGLSSSSTAQASSKSSVKQLLARGSVLERVQQFEKSPSDDNNFVIDYDTSKSDGSSDDGSLSSQYSSTTEQSSKQTYKSRVSLASDNANLNQAETGNLLLRRTSLRRRSSQTSGTINTSQKIPRFYHPNGKPNTYEIEIQNKNIAACFNKFPERRAALVGPSRNRNFHTIALACGLSEYYKEPLYLYVMHQLKEMNTKGTGNNGEKRTFRTLKKAASFDTGSAALESSGNQNFITCDQFLVCWRKVISSCNDAASRFVHILTLGQRKYLIPEDFVPLLQSIIEDHPGLSFLRAAPDFHMRYIQTVVARIFFCINRSWTGKISLSELRRSNLLPVLSVLSQEEDINQITDYFSYEHFYVIYCKFWTLDQDHDLLISKDDLARHNDAAISSRIIDRIFMGIVSREVARTGKLSYTEFVWFLIAEEDKKHPRSIEYWFRLMDLDGDGFISMYEMEYFYYEQMKRLELMGIEAFPFQDCACQILDLVNPNIPNKITLSDLKRSRMTPIFFDTFINLEKYLEHESREFASARDATKDGVVISDWDRYAAEEYELLVSEESSYTTTASNNNATTTTVSSKVLEGTSI